MPRHMPPSPAALDRFIAEDRLLSLLTAWPLGLCSATILNELVILDGHLKSADYARAITRLIRPTKRRPALIERFEDHYALFYRLTADAHKEAR